MSSVEDMIEGGDSPFGAVAGTMEAAPPTGVVGTPSPMTAIMAAKSSLPSEGAGATGKNLLGAMTGRMSAFRLANMVTRFPPFFASGDSAAGPPAGFHAIVPARHGRAL